MNSCLVTMFLLLLFYSKSQPLCGYGLWLPLQLACCCWYHCLCFWWWEGWGSNGRRAKSVTVWDTGLQSPSATAKQRPGHHTQSTMTNGSDPTGRRKRLAWGKRRKQRKQRRRDEENRWGRMPFECGERSYLLEEWIHVYQFSVF